MSKTLDTMCSGLWSTWRDIRLIVLESHALLEERSILSDAGIREFLSRSFVKDIVRCLLTLYETLSPVICQNHNHALSRL